ncbi:MAG: chorismate mutase [Anaerolineales bacterium]
MTVRGVRGATLVEEDLSDAILAATRELLIAIQDANPTLRPADLASALFSVTNDLCSTYPALAARQLGWMEVPLLCLREIPVPGGLPLCIRVLLHWNTNLPQSAIRHVYLGEAVRLRPDIALSELQR